MDLGKTDQATTTLTPGGRISTAFKAEQQNLQPLPVHDSSTYSEHILRVSRTSTIALKRVTYTVPSRLIGSRLMVHLFDARLELWCVGVHTLTLSRIYASAASITTM